MLKSGIVILEEPFIKKLIINLSETKFELSGFELSRLEKRIKALIDY